MSRDGRVELDFGDGTYAFRLGWGEFAELQEKTECGPYHLYNRLVDGTWMVGDISHTLRVGLIGGGTPPAVATKLVRRFVEARPPLENLLLAIAVIGAALRGAPEEGLEERMGEMTAAERTGTGSTTSRTDESDSPPSSALVLQ